MRMVKFNIYKGKISESLWRKSIGTVKCQPVALFNINNTFINDWTYRDENDVLRIRIASDMSLATYVYDSSTGAALFSLRSEGFGGGYIRSVFPEGCVVTGINDDASYYGFCPVFVVNI